VLLDWNHSFFFLFGKVKNHRVDFQSAQQNRAELGSTVTENLIVKKYLFHNLNSNTGNNTISQSLIDWFVA
jgi:hypothetical protein